MPRIIRLPKPGCQYYVPKNKFRATIYFCLSYKELKAELADLSLLRSPKITGQPRTSELSDPTARAASRSMELKRKIGIIEDTVRECAGDILYKYLLAGVTEEGITWETLKMRGIPTNKNIYFQLRKKIFFEISEKM